jgi:hypothetical protein
LARIARRIGVSDASKLAPIEERLKQKVTAKVGR